MRFRFTLNNVPRLPALANWRTQSGSPEWTIDNSPSITLTEASGSDPSGAIEVDFVLTPGEYTFDYNVTIDNGNGGFNQTTFILVAQDGVTIVSDPLTGFKDPPFSGNGTFSGSLTITVLQNSDTFAINVSNFSAFPKTFTINSFTLQGGSNPQEISEPDGWNGAKITLERDDQFFSLIERYEGAAGGSFIFYGENGEENGGIEYIRDVEENYGFDANIEFIAEFAPDDVDYQEIFNGLLELSGKNEMPDNKMQLPVIRDDFWAKFISRMDTPVSLSDTVDLDGNPVDPVEPITVNLTSQTVRKIHYSLEVDRGTSITGVVDDEYLQFTPGKFELDEMEDFYSLIPINQTELPSSTFDVVEEGTYNFDVQWTISLLLGSTENNPNSLDVYLQVNEEDPIQFTRTDAPGTFDFTYFNLTTSLYLLVGYSVRIYAQQTGASQTLTYGFWGTNGLVNGPIDAPFYDQPRPSNMDAVPTYTRVTADTVYPETQVEGYLIHDLIFGVLQRIGLGSNPFYSEFLGSQFTNTKQYDEDGCGWMYVILKGLQIRQYTLTEKPFFISFKQIWDGINPILNLGLGYEIIDDSPDYQVIRIEQKAHFVEDDISVYFSNVRDISSSYDQNMIFKTVKTGYKKWQSENISGIDDPQTKHTYATRFEKVGKEINLESDFIAAGLAIETTRRTTREKSADYKYDNDNFIIALNQDDVSPDVYTPELDENFDSVSGLLNSDTRYNLILTPMRNLLRWANYLGGCLQSYTNSSYKFVSGEGNYDMVSDYSCSLGNQCQAIICDQLSESQDISLGLPGHYNVVFGYFFLPMIYDITIPMEWEEYQEIRNNRKKAIGISQTDTSHVAFKIKLLEYDLVKGEAIIKAWPKTFFRINVIDSTPEMECNVPGPVAFDEDYQAILDYADGEGYDLPSDDQQILQNQLVLDLKAAGVWTELDLLYIFATDGDSDFAKINWVDPGSFTATEVSSPTFTINQGFSNAGTSYLSTGWDATNNAVNFALNDAGVFAYCGTDITAANSFLFGSRDSGSIGRIELLPKRPVGGIDHLWGLNSTGTAARGTGVSSQGFFHIRRTAADDLRLFKDGVQVGTTESGTGTTGPNNDDIYLLATNNNGSATAHILADIGIFGLGTSLSGQESALYTAWNNYFTSL